jgi:uncharacterized membrane protein
VPDTLIDTPGGRAGHMRVRWPISRVVRAIVVVLVLIALASVVRRALDLAQVVPTVEPPRGDSFNAHFAAQPILTFAHILPGAVFLLVGPLQFVRRIRTRHIRVHRALGRMYVAVGAVVGVTALVMSFTLSIGGAVESAATLLFGVYFLVALGMAVAYVRRREIALHREWMLRAFAIGLAIATIRPIIGLFFGLTTLLPAQFFGYAFWIGFSLHAVLAEVWIRATRPRTRRPLSMQGTAA